MNISSHLLICCKYIGMFHKLMIRRIKPTNETENLYRTMKILSFRSWLSQRCFFKRQLHFLCFSLKTFYFSSKKLPGSPGRSYRKLSRAIRKEIHSFACALIFWRAQSANYIPNFPSEMYIFHVHAHSLMLMGVGSTCWVLFIEEV
uniref:Uncharacterized protein n=1 Tax=Micrurus lemniscatus lemniscatus TaxID=129467 RepID=A0A2D4IEG9_MICLE